MIEVALTYDLAPNLDRQRYWELCKRGAALLLGHSNVIEFRVQRNILGSPHVRVTGYWYELSDWAAFANEASFHEIEDELRVLTTNMQLSIWTASPIIPERMAA